MAVGGTSSSSGATTTVMSRGVCMWYHHIYIYIYTHIAIGRMV